MNNEMSPKNYFDQLCNLGGMFTADSNYCSTKKAMTWFDYEYLCYEIYGHGRCELKNEQLHLSFHYEIQPFTICIAIKLVVKACGEVCILSIDFDSGNNLNTQYVITTSSPLSFEIKAPDHKWHFACESTQIFPEFIKNHQGQIKAQ